MMWLLTVTVCLSAQGTAECRKASRLYADLDGCKEGARAMVEYVKQGDPPGLVFAGARCVQGLDT